MDSSFRGLLSDLKQLLVPRTIAEQSQEMLRAPGERGFEALVLWAGRWQNSEPGVFGVEIALMPRQRAVRSERGVAVTVDGDALFDMNVMLNGRGLRLAAQLHSHPGEAYHSETDDRFSVVTARGGLSLVVPDFAREPFSLDSCAVYRLDSRGKWDELQPADLLSLILIVEDS